ncbi:MAG TPA: carbonic anhydrase [Acidimicrobiales bacterium]
MTEIDRLIHANASYSSAHTPLDDGRPARHLAVVTCMDTRIDVLAVLGLVPGEAVVIRNAGARVTEDVLRSLALAVHALGVDAMAVMQHTKCGLTGVTDEGLREHTGADLDFLAIEDHGDSLRSDIELLTNLAYLEPIVSMAGLLYDVDTGRVSDIVHWNRAAQR